MSELSHFDATGRPAMVDIGGKAVSRRVAVAEGVVTISPELAEAVRSDALTKGNLARVAELAGVMAAKRADELIPLCHALPLDKADVRVELDRDGDQDVVRITAEASTSWKTGVEMEALTAVTVAALTVIDMGKAVDKAMVIRSVRLLSKTGGRGGDYHAPSERA